MSSLIRLHGELAPWPAQNTLAELLRAAGLRVTAGRHSLRLADCHHFVFQDFGRVGSDPTIDADAPDLSTMAAEAAQVSAALTRAGVRHRFELYDEADALVGYQHHEWPN